MRRIAAEGHTLALLLDADEKASGDALVEQLTLANERLRLLTGVQTRIVSVSTGCAQLSRAQRDALIAAGYRLWDATLDAGGRKGDGGARLCRDCASLFPRPMRPLCCGCTTAPRRLRRSPRSPHI